MITKCKYSTANGFVSPDASRNYRNEMDGLRNLILCTLFQRGHIHKSSNNCKQF